MAFRKPAVQNNQASEIFLSYIIPTIGRSSLDVAVQSVLSQQFDRAEFEIVVVNDSGGPLPKADWHELPRMSVLNTNKSERSFARNSGAAIARGKYLAFLDDDDWILPGALEAFWDLANQYPESAWLYGGIRIVDEQNRVLAEINSGLMGNRFAQIMGGAWAPIQASVVRAGAFFDAGGFSPFICGTEDEDLCRRISYSGKIANTPETVACLFRGQNWTTSTNYLRAPEDTKLSRDLILSNPDAFTRLLMSADSSYWFGRVLKIYLSTIAWNLRKRRFFKALGRIFYSLAVFIMSIRYVFSVGYWQGVKADHVPQSLHFVIREYEERRKQPGSPTP
jgi:glycosyltransferase involved in cell wall biosynthesis